MPSADINNVWAQTTPVGSVDNITLPSGQTVNAKRIALQDLILAGVVSESDSLTQFVQKHHLTSGNVKQDDAMKAAMLDPQQFGNLVMLVDRIAPHIVVDPDVRLHFIDLEKPDAKGAKTQSIPIEDRVEGVIYTDQIPLQDKIFLMNWGLGDVSQATGFRQESSNSVATMAHDPGVPHHGKRNSKNRKRPR